MKVTYHPQSGDSDIVETYGRVFEAGKSIDIDDEKTLEKLKGNPTFQVGNHKPVVEPKTDDDARLEKAIDGRTKAAREARAKEQEAAADAERKERALKQARQLAEARASKDKE